MGLFHCFCSCREIYVETGVSKPKYQSLSHFCAGEACTLGRFILSWILKMLSLAQPLERLSCSMLLYAPCILVPFQAFLRLPLPGSHVGFPVFALQYLPASRNRRSDHSFLYMWCVGFFNPSPQSLHVESFFCWHRLEQRHYSDSRVLRPQHMLLNSLQSHCLAHFISLEREELEIQK